MHLKTLLVAALTSFAMGCMDEGLDEPLDSSEDALSAKSVNIWPTPSVAVCWDSPATTYATEKARARAAVERSWEAFSGFDTYYWGSCADYQQNLVQSAVRIKIEPNIRAGSVLGTGLMYITGPSMWIEPISTSQCSSGTNAECFDMTVIHEFGHALAFAHEQNRPDTPQWCLDSPQYEDNGHPGDLLLTPWDENSIMNYCSPIYTNAGFLTRWDMYGAQSLYGPARQRHWLVGFASKCLAPDGALTPLARMFGCSATSASHDWSYSINSQQLKNSSGKALAAVAVNGSYPNGSNVQLATSSTSAANQKWTFNNMLVRGFGGKCLTIYTSADDSVVSLASCYPSAGTHQQWNLDTSGRLKNVLSGKCLDRTKAVADYTDTVRIRTCSSSSSQKWSLGQNGAWLQGTEGFVLTSMDGVYVHYRTDNARTADRWNFQGELRGVGGKCLDVVTQNNSAPDGSLAQLQPCNGALDQRWNFYW